jgi:hypothetical protein
VKPNVRLPEVVFPKVCSCILEGFGQLAGVPGCLSRRWPDEQDATDLDSHQPGPLLSQLLALVQPTGPSFSAPPSPHALTTSALGAINKAAFECLSNTFLALAAAPGSLASSEVQAGQRGWSTVWSALACRGGPVCTCGSVGRRGGCAMGCRHRLDGNNGTSPPFQHARTTHLITAGLVTCPGGSAGASADVAVRCARGRR